MGGVSASGDPHLRNINGQAFDVMHPGKYTLLAIPRRAYKEDRLLWVEALALRSGASCADVYFKELNVTGTWAEATHTGGLHYQSGTLSGESGSKWMSVGSVDMKVVHGHTPAGVDYLNFYVRHLGRTGLVVGGLLGVDDHTDAATPEGKCLNRVALQKAYYNTMHAYA